MFREVNAWCLLLSTGRRAVPLVTVINGASWCLIVNATGAEENSN